MYILCFCCLMKPLSKIETRRDSSAPEGKSRTQGSREGHKKIRGQRQGQPYQEQTLSRPRTVMLEVKAKDQGHKRMCSQKKGLQKKFSGDLQKKRFSEKNFRRSPEKNVFQKNFQALHKLLTTQKIVLFSSRGQGHFRGLEASRPRPRIWPSRPRPSQDHQNMSSRTTSSRPRTFSKTPPLLSTYCIKLFSVYCLYFWM